MQLSVTQRPKYKTTQSPSRTIDHCRCHSFTPKTAPQAVTEPITHQHTRSQPSVDIAVPAVNMATPHEFKMPMPPPPLITRSTNEYYDHPSTPGRQGLTSPPQTPSGSPSKNQLPPGAYDLPHVFDNAMKLLPAANGSPSRNTRAQTAAQASSPTRSGIPIAEDRYAVDLPDYAAGNAAPGSPTRKANKENTPPGIRPSPKKESSFVTQAQQSRQAAYKTQDEASAPKHTIQRGLSPEDLEKLQKPAIKRLANVTQLCECAVRHWVATC